MYKCQECGRKFKTTRAAQRAADKGCPKCGGVDIDLDYEPASVRDEYPDHPREHGETPVSRRGGCKVYWETFATREEAQRAAAWAFVEAEIRERQGYDSGFCSPGSIDEVADGFEVCFL